MRLDAVVRHHRQRRTQRLDTFTRHTFDVHDVDGLVRAAGDIGFQIEDVEPRLGQRTGHLRDDAGAVGAVHGDTHVGFDVFMQLAFDAIHVQVQIKRFRHRLY